MTDRKNEIHTMSANLKLALNALIEVAQETDEVSELVEIGYVLWNVSKLTKEGIEPIKARLREVAVKQNNHQPGKVKLAGLEFGQTIVTVPRPRITLDERAPIETLKSKLGEDFHQIFRERIKYLVNLNPLEEYLEDHDGDEKDLLMQYLNQETRTPRVGFRIQEDEE